MQRGNYSFAAIKGHQGNSDYFLAQCLFKLAARIFLFDEAEVPTNIRVPHTINQSFVSSLKNYVLTNEQDYLLEPLIVSVDEEFIFSPLNGQESLGLLQIPFSAKLIVCAGHHSREAIKELLSIKPEIGNDLIPVIFIKDIELVRSPKIYEAQSAIYTRQNSSQKLLNAESDLANLTRQLIKEVPIFKGLTELEKTTISNRSKKVFTLNAIFQATRELLGVRKNSNIDEMSSETAVTFWRCLSSIIPEWNQVVNGEVTPSYLRQNYIHVHSVTLCAIGKVGHDLIAYNPDNWREQLKEISRVDWSRENKEQWEGRSMIRGRMNKSRTSIQLTANSIKLALKLPLTDKELDLEKELNEANA